MILRASSLNEITTVLAGAHAREERVTSFDLRALARVIEHTPEDMTVTAEAGLTLAALQAELARRGQWLPIDPPDAGRLTLGALLATNASGPRRLGCGTIRDHLLGLKVALADGRLIKSGGKVVKNVAGYDLQKLFVGSRGSLGVIVAATFKLRPLPEDEQFVQAACGSLEKAGVLVEIALESALTPVVLDLHNGPWPLAQRTSPFTLVAGFAGTREEVAWQLARAHEMGFSEPATLDYETSFRAVHAVAGAQRLSVLPSRTVDALHQLGDVPFVARAGNGVIEYIGAPQPAKSDLPLKLMRRLKETFDPKHILPDMPP